MTDENFKTINFIAQISRSGRKRLINIPSDKFKDLSEDIEYYKIYMVPIQFNDLDKEREGIT